MKKASRHFPESISGLLHFGDEKRAGVLFWSVCLILFVIFAGLSGNVFGIGANDVFNGATAAETMQADNSLFNAPRHSTPESNSSARFNVTHIIQQLLLKQSSQTRMLSGKCHNVFFGLFIAHILAGIAFLRSGFRHAESASFQLGVLLHSSLPVRAGPRG